MTNNYETELPEIEWDILDSYDDAGDGYCFFHHAEGTSADGRKWTASATMVMGELDSMEDIEETPELLTPNK
jgi:hypothetical protein